MRLCIIGNAYCIPCPCANCYRIFCAHEHPEKRAFGYYGQYCSKECQDAKCTQIWEIGKTRFQYSRVVLIVEFNHCYLVLNRHKDNKEAKGGYGFKILHESAESLTDKLALDYSHFPGLGVGNYPITFTMMPKLQVALSLTDEYDKSMWTIVGFRVLSGEIDTYGVGGHIEVVDLRSESEAE